jgi:hypothetical protein
MMNTGIWSSSSPFASAYLVLWKPPLMARVYADDLRLGGSREEDQVRNPFKRHQPVSEPEGSSQNKLFKRHQHVSEPEGSSLKNLQPVLLKPWLLPFIVLAVAVPIVAAFMFGGPAAGLAVGAIAAAVILILAARARYDEPIEVGPPPEGLYALLVVLATPLEDPGLAGAVAEIAWAGARATGADGPLTPDILVVAPAFNKGLAHWLSDLGSARFEAQRRLAVSLGTLAAANLEARGRVGDSDAVQAIEDTLRTFPAQEVVFIAGPDQSQEIDDVRRRLDRPVRQLPRPARAPAPSRS